ncbi:MAG: hypothetical protein MHM6MM_000219 [Cercozoa sp. M6MM]
MSGVVIQDEPVDAVGTAQPQEEHEDIVDEELLASLHGDVIEPPAAVKQVMETALKFVRKHGLQFEHKAANNPKLAFINAGHVYHPYYRQQRDTMLMKEGTDDEKRQVQEERQRLREEKKRKEEEKRRLAAEKKRKEAATLQARLLKLWRSHRDLPDADEVLQQQGTEGAKASSCVPCCDAADDHPMDIGGGGGGPVFRFHAPLPRHASRSDVDIIKLAAYYYAKYGERFLMDLKRKEEHNSQFNFLRALHPLHGYFRSLVDSYRRVLLRRPASLVPGESSVFVSCSEEAMENAMAKLALQESDKRKRRLQHHLDTLRMCTFDTILQEVRQGAVKRRLAKEARARADADEAEERAAVAEIDFLDFVVLRQIDVDLMPPLRDPNVEVQKEGVLPRPFVSVAAVDQMFAAAAEADREKEEAEKKMQRQQQRDMEIETPAADMQVEEDEGDVEMEMEVESDEEVVVATAVPQEDEEPQVQPLMTIDPVTKKLVPVSQINEHMRVQLISDQWKEQRDKYLARTLDTNLADDSSIAHAVERMAKKRAAMKPGGGALAEELNREKRLAQPWDGHSASIKTVTTMAANKAFLEAQRARKTGVARVPFTPAEMEQHILPPNAQRQAARSGDGSQDQDDRSRIFEFGRQRKHDPAKQAAKTIAMATAAAAGLKPDVREEDAVAVGKVGESESTEAAAPAQAADEFAAAGQRRPLPPAETSEQPPLKKAAQSAPVPVPVPAQPVPVPVPAQPVPVPVQQLQPPAAHVPVPVMPTPAQPPKEEPKKEEGGLMSPQEWLQLYPDAVTLHVLVVAGTPVSASCTLMLVLNLHVAVFRLVTRAVQLQRTNRADGAYFAF